MKDSPSPMAEQAGSVSQNEVAESTSRTFIGRWNTLVSTTNWEKGRIIYQWREALIAAGAAAVEYSDEAWALRVGGVTGQHVGRLRRVYQRFGEKAEEFEGLYWSHFQAAIEWDDAEMWLEGAVQSGWSVSQMRRQRWETLGAVASDEPQEGDVVVAETDEDFDTSNNESPIASTITSSYGEVPGPRPEGPDFGDEEAPSADAPKAPAERGDGAAIYTDGEKPVIEFVQPFETLSELPEDLADAFESFKLAILRHKASDWQEIDQEDVLAALDALKELARAPAADDVTF